MVVLGSFQFYTLSENWLKREEKKTHLSKKQLAIIALVVILTVTNIALAVLYMTKNVNISGGLSVVGAIEVYEEDGVTPLTSFTFENFTGGVLEIRTLNFFVNNTGNAPVYVYWNISASSIAWIHESGSEFYRYYEAATYKYNFQIQTEAGFANTWNPNTGVGAPEAVYLDVDGGQLSRFWLAYTGEPVTAETFTFTVSFYAQNA